MADASSAMPRYPGYGRLDMNRRSFLKFMALGTLISSLSKKLKLRSTKKKAMFWRKTG